MKKDPKQKPTKTPVPAPKPAPKPKAPVPTPTPIPTPAVEPEPAQPASPVIPVGHQEPGPNFPAPSPLHGQAWIEQPPPDAPKKHPVHLVLHPASATLAVKETVTFAGQLLHSPAPADVTYAMDTPTVATVDAKTGIVTGVAVGHAILTARSGDAVATAAVTVTK